MLKYKLPFPALFSAILFLFLFTACTQEPAYIATPEKVMDKLRELGKQRVLKQQTEPSPIQQAQPSDQPFQFDRLGGVIIRNQLVVWFRPEDTTEQVQDLTLQKRESDLNLRRKGKGPRRNDRLKVIQSCPCEPRLALVHVGSGDPVGVLNSSGGSSDTKTVSGQGLNNITHILENGKVCEPKSLPTEGEKRDNDITIAILDTGIDWSQEGCGNLNTKLWFNSNEKTGISGTDEGSNGLMDDVFGYDFVEDDALPFDMHGHGTHVAGIVSGTFEKVNESSFKILTYRVLDQDGFGNIFDSACAAICAAKNGAKVINMSFGWYGEESAIFGLALNYIELEYPDVVVVAAVGNDTLDMLYVDKRIFPAGYASPIVVGVGSTDEKPFTYSTFSNYFHWFTDIAAPGDSIMSCLPCDNRDMLSGTSMAAPFVSAEFGIAKLAGIPHADVLVRVLNTCVKDELDHYKVKGGKRTDDGQLPCVQ